MQPVVPVTCCSLISDAEPRLGRLTVSKCSRWTLPTNMHRPLKTKFEKKKLYRNESSSTRYAKKQRRHTRKLFIEPGTLIDRSVQWLSFCFRCTSRHRLLGSLSLVPQSKCIVQKDTVFSCRHRDNIICGTRDEHLRAAFAPYICLLRTCLNIVLCMTIATGTSNKKKHSSDCVCRLTFAWCIKSSTVVVGRKIKHDLTYPPGFRFF